MIQIFYHNFFSLYIIIYYLILVFFNSVISYLSFLLIIKFHYHYILAIYNRDINFIL